MPLESEDDGNMIGTVLKLVMIHLLLIILIIGALPCMTRTSYNYNDYNFHKYGHYSYECYAEKGKQKKSYDKEAHNLIQNL